MTQDVAPVSADFVNDDAVGLQTPASAQVPPSIGLDVTACAHTTVIRESNALQPIPSASSAPADPGACHHADPLPPPIVPIYSIESDLTSFFNDMFSHFGFDYLSRTQGLTEIMTGMHAAMQVGDGRELQRLKS